MKIQYLASLVGGLSFVTAQSDTPTGTALPSATDTLSINTESITGSAVPSFTETAAATSVALTEACAAVSSVLAAQTAAPYEVDAELANECQLSVPLIKEDALAVIDGIMAGLAFQSDLEILASPPQGYLLAGVDLIGELQKIRDQVDSGAMTSEIEFERNVTTVIMSAQDGHLDFEFDGMGVFVYARQFGLVSISLDGKEAPNLYTNDAFGLYLKGETDLPPTVTHINGQDAVQFVLTESQNITFGDLQDPDALYNNEMYQLNSGQGNTQTIGAFAQSVFYVGANTTLDFSDGNSTSLKNYAIFLGATVDGLTDGPSYYDLYCNATRKSEQQQSSGGSSAASGSAAVHQRSKSLLRRDLHHIHLVDSAEKAVASETASATASATTPTATQLTGYPSPIALSSDLTLSGYFLEGVGFEDTAVLVAQSQSEADPVSFLKTVTTFLDACRSANKTRLVLDVQGNPGGSVATGYGLFKQLFPDLWPYGAATLRAHEGLDTLGTFYTNWTSQVFKQDPNNVTLLNSDDYYMQYSAEAWANDSGQLFKSWPELYGPVETPIQNYTNLIRWDINNTNFDLGSGGLVIPGFGNETDLEPSPFTSDNIIILSNGQCSSTCTILCHLLKWQGKVKSVAVGGRPTTGAMQTIGGIKGSQVYSYLSIQQDVSMAYQEAKALGYDDQANAINSSKTLGSILNQGQYVILRTAHAGVGASAATDFQVNWQNNIAEGDTSYTPLQYVYEAADCHLWYQPQHVHDVSTLWTTVAAQAFGLNNTDVFSLCVDGSTKDPSSLSGNATLYNNGNPTNVTDFQPEVVHASSSKNGVERLTMSAMAIVCAIAATMFML